MKNLKVSRKLTISYGFILSLLVISIVVSIGNLISIRSKVEVFYNGPFRVLNAANTVNSSFEAMQKSVFRAISSTSQANTEQALENARAWERKIQEQIPVIQKDFLGDRQLLNGSRQPWTNLHHSVSMSWILQYRIKRRKPLLIWKQTIS